MAETDPRANPDPNITALNIGPAGETTNAPITGALSTPPAPDKISLQSPAPPRKPSVGDRVAGFISGGQGTPGSVWRGILSGALSGMTAGAGQGHVGTGVAAGAQAAEKQRQQQFENRLQQSREDQQRQLTAATIAKTNHEIWDSAQKLRMQQASAGIEYAQAENNLEKEAYIISGDSKDLGVLKDLSDEEIARVRAQHPEWAKDLAKGNIFTVPHMTAVLDAKGNATGEFKYDGVRAFYVPPDQLNKTLDHEMEIPMFVPGKTAKEPGHFESRTIGPKDHLTGQQAMKLWQEQQSLAAKYNSELATAKATEETATAQYKLGKMYADKEKADEAIAQAKNDGRDVVNLDLNPQSIPRRGATWEVIRAETDRYAMQKYGHPFDWAKADADFKETEKYRPVLDYSNSLTGMDGNSGSLGMLQRLSNSITRTDYPAINKPEQWLDIQKGDPAITTFKEVLTTEVADQVAKILQGGGTGSASTDAKLRQAQDMFNSAFNKKTMDMVISTLREALNYRKQALMQNNMYLMKWYGPNSAIVKSQQPQGGAATPGNPLGLPGGPTAGTPRSTPGAP